VAGVAGLVAGALSMAAGEYVSVSSQADTEQADLARERTELATDHEGEEEELTGIYVGRGLDRPLAENVAKQLMARDALAAHARDELGISEQLTARPLQAALASAATFAIGAGLPILTAALAPRASLTTLVAVTSLCFLAALGAIAARVGGASAAVGAGRVAFWGALAMGVTAGVGALVGDLVDSRWSLVILATNDYRLSTKLRFPMARVVLAIVVVFAILLAIRLLRGASR